MPSPAQHANRPRQRHTPTYPLQELFDDDELTLKLQIARHRITKTFVHATVMSRGKRRETDNYIVGVGPRQKDLVAHVIGANLANHRSGIVTASELPACIGSTAAVLRAVAKHAEHQLVTVQLSLLCPSGVWYNEDGTGAWEIAPTLTDEYHRNRHVVSEAKRIDARLRREALHGGGRLRVVH